MSHQDLHTRFRRITIPEPGEKAEMEALAAARAEFHRASEESEKNVQGFSGTRRPTDRTTFLESLMSVFSGKHKTSVALGSTAILALGAGLAMHSMHPSPAPKATPVAKPSLAQSLPLQDSSDAQNGGPIGKTIEEPGPMDSLMKAISPGNDEVEPSLSSSMANPPASPQEKKVAAAASAKASLGGFANFQTGYRNADAGAGARDHAPVKAAENVYTPRVQGAYVPYSESPATPAYEGQDKYPAAEPNPVKQAAEEPVSTFSIDTDTASYALVRRMLNEGRLPPRDAVRVEELVNYFNYDYALPKTREVPFEPSVAVVPCPWDQDKRLVHIGIKGYELPAQERPHANLVLLIDTSGSMASQDRLPLLKNAFRLLLNNLQPTDTISIVSYAGAAGTVLEPTPASDKSTVIAAIDRLNAGGGTAGFDGLQQAYALAEAHFDKNGVNRILLATDGDFNVGISDPQQLKDYIAQKRKDGVFLSVLGVGAGNYNDTMMQTLAQNGNGNASYIDSLSEAQKVLVQEAGSTLFTIAKDVKIQVEFNPSNVAEYRLLGYETRMLKREDFNNDAVDAGEVGAGHAVTAIYEITPADAKHRSADPLRYAKPAAAAPQAADRGGDGNELAFLKLRYKLPNEDKSRLLSRPITLADATPTLDAAPQDTRFAIAVAEYGLLLRHDPAVEGRLNYDEALKLGEAARGNDPFGNRADFLNLVRLAGSLTGNANPSRPETE